MKNKFRYNTLTRPSPREIKIGSLINFSTNIRLYSPNNDQTGTIVNCFDGINVDSTKAIARSSTCGRDIDDDFSEQKASVKETLVKNLRLGVEYGISAEELQNWKDQSEELLEYLDNQRKDVYDYTDFNSGDEYDSARENYDFDSDEEREEDEALEASLKSVKAGISESASSQGTAAGKIVSDTQETNNEPGNQTSSNSGVSKRFPQDSSDVFQSDFPPFESFEE